MKDGVELSMLLYLHHHCCKILLMVSYFTVFGQAMLQCLGCLLPFLDNDMIGTLPYMTASLIAVLPNTLHQEIVNTLCFYVLPFTISKLLH